MWNPKAMFGKKEKWEERKGRREKLRENKKLGCLVRGKNSDKKKYMGPTKNASPKLERKHERKFDWL